MRELGLTGLSEDGQFLVAHDELTDESFLIPTDLRLTSLLGARTGGTAPNSGDEPGAREPTMEVTLSPREIQTRVRRGESAEQIAEDSGMPLDKVRGFAVPVLAEREFIVEQARKTSVRQLRSSGGPSELLGSLVDESVASGGMVPESASWDSWRREDGKWTVVVATDVVPAPATFLFDVKGRYVLPADDAALELIGDFSQPEVPEMAIVDAVREATGVDLLQAEAASGSQLEAQATEPVEADVVPEASSDDASHDVDDAIGAVLEESFTEVLAEELNEVDVADVPFDLPVEDYFEATAQVSSLKEARDRRALEQLAMSIETGDAPTEASDVEITDEHDLAVPDATHPSKRNKHERRRVPSWDEIMFGGRQD
jgi:hypothetical protein